jgi:endonuclease G
MRNNKGGFFGFIFLIGALFSSCNYVKTAPVEAVTKENVKTEQVYPERKDSVNISEERAVSCPYMEIPATENEKLIVHHTAYSLLYSEEHEQASWIAYELTSEETDRKFERSNKFLVDDAIKTGSANDGDYKGSGYDRGHLAPAADMSWSKQTMLESFYYSNMSPQDPSFNRGIWKKLEELVRTWARENNSLYVVTGPILSDNLPTIGSNKVSIPSFYYKVLLDYSQPDFKAIGFIIPNQGSKADLSSFAVSIDKVEQLTGLNFFPNLPDQQENALESSVCIPCWSWNASKSSSRNNKQSNSSVSVQCNGITQKGARCKRMTLDPSGFCYQHH